MNFAVYISDKQFKLSYTALLFVTAANKEVVVPLPRKVEFG
jgi:hypothetical protein